MIVHGDGTRRDTAVIEDLAHHETLFLTITLVESIRNTHASHYRMVLSKENACQTS